MSPAALAAILDPAGARPAPYWTQLPEPGPAASYAEREAYKRDVRQCWNRRMALVEAEAARRREPAA